LINEVEILNEAKWKVKLLRTMEQSYKKAPQFSNIFELIHFLFNKEQSHISAFNVESIKAVCSYLGISTQIVPSSTHYQNKHLSGQNRIIDICQKEKANHYINPIGGVSLYDKFEFAAKGIELKFIQTRDINYIQGNTQFIPCLSILDVLMFNSIEQVKEMLNQYELL
jgi:hypothetical protein